MKSSQTMRRSEANFPDPPFRDAISAAGTAAGASSGRKIEAYLANIGRRATAAYSALLAEFAKMFSTEDFQERVRPLRQNRQPIYRGR